MNQSVEVVSCRGYSSTNFEKELAKLQNYNTKRETLMNGVVKIQRRRRLGMNQRVQIVLPRQDTINLMVG